MKKLNVKGPRACPRSMSLRVSPHTTCAIWAGMPTFPVRDKDEDEMHLAHMMIF